MNALCNEWLPGDEKLVNIFNFAMQNLSWSRTNQARDGETENTGRKHLICEICATSHPERRLSCIKRKTRVLLRSRASRSEAAEVVSLFSLHE